jgi:hypothetical protein
MPIMDQVLNEVAALLNKEYKIKPILYASYNLEKVLVKSFQAHDIDLFIPKELLNKKNQLISLFVKNGFQYVEAEVLTFSKQGTEIELADKEKWFSICELDVNGVTLISNPLCQYWMLNAENLLRLYKHLSISLNRPLVKLQKDYIKIKALESYLKINR